MPDDSRIIVALDVMDPVVARDIAKKVSNEVFALKIGWPLMLSANADIINDLSRYAKIICDLKVADIPFTNKLITERIKENGAWGIIAHAFLGKDSLEAVVQAAGEMKVFSLVAMSHPGSSYFLDKRLKELARISLECNVYGVVAPGNKPAMLKKTRKLVDGLKIISPGIGTQGGDAQTAIKNGADYLIAGRSIINAEDPREEVRKINASLAQNKG
jgi:orotidine-5'-phosphate decarboxylase